jgi:hypothetical protein
MNNNYNNYCFEKYFNKDIIEKIKSFVIEPGPNSKTSFGYKKIVHKYNTEFVPENKSIAVTPFKFNK